MTSVANKKYYEDLSTAEKKKHRDTLVDAFSVEVVANSLSDFFSAHRAAPVRWLDIGCGRGMAAKLAERFSASYTGLDLAENNIEACRREFPRQTFLQGDFADLELEGKFQLITFISTLHHFPDWRGVLAKAESLLAPGGMIFIEQEPMRIFSGAYGLYLRLFSREYDSLRAVEIHWLQQPSILPAELPVGITEYHFDFLPFFRHLQLRFRNGRFAFLFPHFRKWIMADTPK